MAYYIQTEHEEIYVEDEPQAHDMAVDYEPDDKPEPPDWVGTECHHWTEETGWRFSDGNDWWDGDCAFCFNCGTRLNADGTVTEMVERVTYANDNAGPAPCDFCGAKHATPQCLPDLNYPEPSADTWIGRWGHPYTGNVCRECAVKQLAKASGGRLVERVTSEAVRATRLMRTLEKAERIDVFYADDYHLGEALITLGLGYRSNGLSCPPTYALNGHGNTIFVALQQPDLRPALELAVGAIACSDCPIEYEVCGENPHHALRQTDEAVCRKLQVAYYIEQAALAAPAPEPLSVRRDRIAQSNVSPMCREPQWTKPTAQEGE